MIIKSVDTLKCYIGKLELISKLLIFSYEKYMGVPCRLKKTCKAFFNFYTTESSKEGLIREYLERLLPKDWGKLDIGARRLFIHGTDFGEVKEGTVQREKVCAMEIWVELFQAEPKQLSPIQAREINDILRKIEGWKEYSNGTGKLKFGRNYGLQRAFIRETYA